MDNPAPEAGKDNDGNVRLTVVEIQTIITQDVIPLLKTNHTFSEITRLMQTKHNKSESACKNYVAKAIEALKVDFNRDVAEQRMEMITSLRHDMSETYNNYLASDTERNKQGWYNTYLSIKKRICELSPNELRAEETTSKTTINITYEDAKPEDRDGGS